MLEGDIKGGIDAKVPLHFSFSCKFSIVVFRGEILGNGIGDSL